MPMSPGRWARQSIERSREQRAAARARLLGAPIEEAVAPHPTQPDLGRNYTALQEAAARMGREMGNLGQRFMNVGAATAALAQQQDQERIRAEAVARVNDMVLRCFGELPPMRITNFSIRQELPPVALMPRVAMDEAFAQVPTFVAYMPPETTVEIEGVMPMREDAWHVLNQWMQDPDRRVRNITWTDHGGGGGPHINILASPNVPPGEAYIVNEAAMRRFEYAMPEWGVTQYTTTNAAGFYFDAYGNAMYGRDPMTPEERAEREREQQAQWAEQRRVQQEREAERVAAYQRAKDLFVSMLTPTELKDLEKKKSIFIKGSKGNNYEIMCGGGQSGNVYWLDRKGKRLGSLCAHPYKAGVGYLPDPDAWLAQKLMITTDEEKFGGHCPRPSRTEASVRMNEPLYWRAFSQPDDISFMTYDMFVHDFTVFTKRTKQRHGTVAYNMLYRLKPELARAISDTPLDPFANDEALPEFFTYVEQHWDEPAGQ